MSLKREIKPLLVLIILLSILNSFSLRLIFTIILVAVIALNGLRFSFGRTSYIIFLCSFLMMTFWPHKTVQTGRVVKITDTSFTIQNGLSKQCYFSKESVAFDSIINVEQKVSQSDFGCLEVESVKLLKSERSFINSLHSYLVKGDSHYLLAIIFDSYSVDSLTLIQVMFFTSAKVQSMINLIYVCSRFKFFEKSTCYFCLGFLLLYITCFNLSIGVFRLVIVYVLRVFKVEKTTATPFSYIIILSILSNPWTQMSLIFPLLLYFINQVLKDTRIRFLSSYITQSMLVGQFNVIGFLLYPVLKVSSCFIFLFILLLFSLKIPFLFVENLFVLMADLDNVLNYLTWVGRWPMLFSMFFLIYASTTSTKMRQISILCCILLNFSLSLYKPYLSVTYINVGQGDAILIQYQMENILIDTGKPSSYHHLSQTLRTHGVKRIHELIITHDDNDHSGNLKELVRDFDVYSIIDNKNKSLSTSIPLITMLDSKEYSSENANSRILFLSANQVSFLFTGDAGVEQEMEIVRQFPHLNVDILKLGHHGSKSSTSLDFLSVVKPLISIVSAQKKAYGHPHDSVLRNVEKVKSYLLNTETHGDITFYITNLFQFYITDTFEFGIIGWGR